MKIPRKKLKTIVERVLRETRSYADTEEVRQAYHTLYVDNGFVNVSELASVLGMPEEEAEMAVIDAGLHLSADGDISDF